MDPSLNKHSIFIAVLVESIALRQNEFLIIEIALLFAVVVPMFNLQMRHYSKEYGDAFCVSQIVVILFFEQFCLDKVGKLT